MFVITSTGITGVKGILQTPYKNDLTKSLLEELQTEHNRDVLSEILKKSQTQRDEVLDRELQPTERQNSYNDIAETDVVEDRRDQDSFNARAVDSLLTGAQRDAEDNTENVDRRDALQLASMVELTTGETAIKYLKYGCWCGPGGSGTPLDNLDRCCKAHDQCYVDQLKKKGCSTSYYFNTYKWEKDGTSIVCPSDCDTCKYRQCICDMIVADCLADHKSEYSYWNTITWWFRC